MYVNVMVAAVIDLIKIYYISMLNVVLCLTQIKEGQLSTVYMSMYCTISY